MLVNTPDRPDVMPHVMVTRTFFYQKYGRIDLKISEQAA